MLRKDKEITDKNEIEEILKKAVVLRLGIMDSVRPYVVPVCFGYKEDTFYFHSAKKGKKIDLLKKNGNVSFETDTGVALLPGDKSCNWSMEYESVMGFGKASFIDDPGEKEKALRVIMGQYTGLSFPFPGSSLKVTEVVKIDVLEMSGKRSVKKE